jgi:hypothetical protein
LAVYDWEYLIGSPSLTLAGPCASFASCFRTRFIRSLFESVLQSPFPGMSEYLAKKQQTVCQET